MFVSALTASPHSRSLLGSLKNDWVLPNRKQLFESQHDFAITIQQIIGYDLKNSEFAYLPACYTTVENEGSPDE